MPSNQKRSRSRKKADFLAQCGWWDTRVQAVVKKYTPILGDFPIQDAFFAMRRSMEEAGGIINLVIGGYDHRNCATEMMVALNRLHSRNNLAGWVIKLCGYFMPDEALEDGQKIPFTMELIPWEQFSQEIIDRGGPKFSASAIRQAAVRLKLTCREETDVLIARYRGVKIGVRKKSVDKINQKLIQDKNPVMLEWLAEKKRNATPSC